MELRDVGGTRFVSLEPVGYQFSAMSGDVYDDNWLDIRGRVQSDNESWKFLDPCLLVDEAAALGRWLQLAALGKVAPMVPDEHGFERLATDHLEPNLGFGLVAFESDAVTIRAFLWLESAPPGTPGMEFSMDLTLLSADLERAATNWQEAVSAFPQRR
jgi:hypothetical protein